MVIYLYLFKNLLPSFEVFHNIYEHIYTVSMALRGYASPGRKLFSYYLKSPDNLVFLNKAGWVINKYYFGENTCLH